MLGLHCCPGFFLIAASRGCSVAAVSRRLITGFSCCWAQAPGHAAFSSCGPQQLRGMSLVALGHVESSRTRDQTRVSCIGRQILYHWATKEALFCLFFQTDYSLLGSPLGTEDTSNPTKSKSQHPKQKHKSWPRRTWICCSGNRHRKYIWEWGWEGVVSPKQEGGPTLLLEEKGRDDLDCFSRLG